MFGPLGGCPRIAKRLCRTTVMMSKDRLYKKERIQDVFVIVDRNEFRREVAQ